ncbi:hypothetical protein [Cyanobium gracile]|uniref:Uncharacterized protein n=1 Tax=Cyanobium gracile (strain ATCC 27147 / PCC 6307) TaxID=292564 RepID=K9PAE3_CYAGP|nr:hypothetical protein [Cyanobium gracile]AFY29908.1 hypothetical protein Cyagr_2816 [Cyanobium gracile PCC 6307]
MSTLLSGGSAFAATSSFVVDLNKSFGDSYTGVTGTMNFLFGDAGDSNPSTYTLDLTIKNTSGSPITSSSLTGFAFDTPTSVSSLVYNRNGTNFYQATDLTIAPAPSFTFCASTDNNINNGTQCGAGSVPQGLSNGQSATVKYTFNFAGLNPGVSDVSTAFFNLFNGLVVSPPPNDTKVVNSTVVLAARFQEINTASSTGGSDKVTGKPRGSDPAPGDAVPGPLPLLGAAAGFLQSRKLRKRLAKARLANHGQL